MVSVINQQHVKKRRHIQPSDMRLRPSRNTPDLRQHVPDMGGRIGQGLRTVVLVSLIVAGAAGLLAIFSPLAVWAYDIELPAEADVEVLLARYLDPAPESSEEEPESAPVPREEFASLSVREHVLREGETLSLLAQRYNLHIDTIISFNEIRDVRRVARGRTLSIPTMNGLLYTVRLGDSLERIARSHGVAINRILDSNNLESSVIHPGQRLFIPGVRMRPNDLRRVLGELFIYPAVGRLASGFGYRNDPFTGIRRFHNGIDLAGAHGSPIVAAMAGRVAKVGIHSAFGRYVIINHQDGYQTWYAHLDRAVVSQGQRVAQGQKIGEMGNTGYSTGTHLHFSVFRSGTPIDPMRVLQ